jgi:BolA protein
MTADRLQQIQERLTAEFAPLHLQVKDQSHLHVGHAGARDGMGHFEATIVADAFAGKQCVFTGRAIISAKLASR